MNFPVYKPTTNTWIIPINYDPNNLPENEETSNTTYIEVSNEEYNQKYLPKLAKQKYNIL